MRLKRREGRRPAILLGLRDNENDSGVIKVWSRKLQVFNSVQALALKLDLILRSYNNFCGGFKL